MCPLLFYILGWLTFKPDGLNSSACVLLVGVFHESLILLLLVCLLTLDHI